MRLHRTSIHAVPKAPTPVPAQSVPSTPPTGAQGKGAKTPAPAAKDRAQSPETTSAAGKKRLGTGHMKAQRRPAYTLSRAYDHTHLLCVPWNLCMARIHESQAMASVHEAIVTSPCLHGVSWIETQARLDRRHLNTGQRQN